MAAEVASIPSSGSLHRDETAPQTRGHAGNQIVELDANTANYVQGNDRTHDTDYLEEMKLAHYRPTPLPVPFTPLSALMLARSRRGPNCSSSSCSFAKKSCAAVRMPFVVGVEEVGVFV